MMKLFSNKLVFPIAVGIIAVILTGIFVYSLQASAISQESVPVLSATVVDETQYLVFMVAGEGIYEAPKKQVFDLINARVSKIINQIGTVGAGKSRKLGYGILIPPWMIDAGFPGKLPVLIREAFNVAKRRNIAVHFTMETHYFWETRPDLWKNPANVEWMDWKGTPHPNRYLDWGTPVKLAPHMCYNCPQVKKEISRLVSKVIGPPIKAGIDDLRKIGKEYLFAGVTVGSEPSLDDYSKIDTINPAMGRLMRKNKAPKVRLGYNALSNAGYSEKNPPKDFHQALAKINQEFIAFWAKLLLDAGIPSSRLYTHVAAATGVLGSAPLEFTNAPLWIAFNDYSRPGWTTYPDGVLEKDFEVLYKELQKHGNPHWGGTEASPYGLSGVKIPVNEYLSRHFDHGTTLVVMNTGATSAEVEKRLVEGVWGKGAISAYRKFLSGQPLESQTTKEFQKSEKRFNENPAGRIQRKIQRIQKGIQRGQQEDRDPSPIGKIMEQFEPLMQKGKIKEAEELLDRALKLLDDAGMSETQLSQSPPQFLQRKMQQVEWLVPEWVASGGNHAEIAPFGQKIDSYLKAGKFKEAEEVIDQILIIVGGTEKSIKGGPCQEIVPDKEFHCPYRGINENDDLILSKFKALYSVKADGSDQETLILESPESWGIVQNSISPNHERMLLTMEKPSCSQWPSSDGLLCSYGRNVIWIAYHEENNPADQNDDIWILRNLAYIYGRNADVHGWTSWQSNKFALFNALIRPDNEPIFGYKQEDNNAQAYQIRFDSNHDIQIDLWGVEKMYREDCLIGRLFSSHPQNQDSCIDGQRVVFARRCYSQPKTYESHAWWNTKNMDGTGGTCISESPAAQVPILRNYVVETDIQCQPKTTFDINKPIHQPKKDSIYRHMGGTPEWGEMQPAISKDGRFVAFHTVKGFDDSAPEDNCAGFNYNGNSSASVYYCELDQNLQCKATKKVPKPGSVSKGQGQPFFFEEDGQLSLIITEGSSGISINIEKESQDRLFLFEGIGGYPLR